MTQPKWSEAFKFLDQGALIQEFNVAGQNIVLGFKTPELYQKDFNPYFGETIGRVANRIAGARIQSLNGISYKLEANNGPNTSHGGLHGWGKKEFQRSDTTEQRNGKEALLFKYLSHDGDEGFPGTVELRVWYTPSVESIDGREKSTLEIEYEAELVGDEVEETAISVTNHSYFNLSNAPTIEGTRATLQTNLHQVKDDNDIPTGAIEPFPGFQSEKEFVLGREEPDIDHCLIVNDRPETVPLDTRTQSLTRLCHLYHPDSKIHLEASSTEPAFVFYTGKYNDVPAVDGMPARGPRSGFCIEAARYVNAINDERWRGMVVMRKGQVYGSRTVYNSWKET